MNKTDTPQGVESLPVVASPLPLDTGAIVLRPEQVAQARAALSTLDFATIAPATSSRSR